MEEWHTPLSQIFNMFNSRKINDELNVFENVTKSKLFWIMLVIMCGAQVIIMELIPGVFKVDSQTWEQWLIAIAIGIGSIPFALLVKLATRGLHAALAAMRRTSLAPQPRTMSQMPVLQRNDSRRSQVSITASSTAAEDVGDVVRCYMFILVCHTCPFFLHRNTSCRRRTTSQHPTAAAALPTPRCERAPPKTAPKSGRDPWTRAIRATADGQTAPRLPGTRRTGAAGAGSHCVWLHQNQQKAEQKLQLQQRQAVLPRAA